MSSSPAPAPGQPVATPARRASEEPSTGTSSGGRDRQAAPARLDPRGRHARSCSSRRSCSSCSPRRPQAKWSTAVFGLTAVMLFGTSAVYHRGHWSPQGRRRSCAGSTTPTSSSSSRAPTRRCRSCCCPPTPPATLLIVVWSGALVGLLARVFWLGAPRWVYVPVYVALGWVAVWFFPEFYRSGGLAIVAAHRRRRARLHARRGRLRHQAAQPEPALVRVPRDLPRADRGRVRRATTSRCRWRRTASA